MGSRERTDVVKPEPYWTSEDGRIVIYHGDAREIVPLIDADVIVCDPPYGFNTALNKGGEKGRPTPKELRAVPDWDTSLEAREEVMRLWVPRPAAVFASITQPIPAWAEPSKRPLVWDKGEEVGMGDTAYPWRPNYELVWVIGDGWHGPRGSSILRFPISPRNRVHPTQKPVALMRAIIQKAPPGTVLDPFMGSGTTLRAAADLGRKAIGIEINEDYCKIAIERLRQGVLL